MSLTLALLILTAPAQKAPTNTPTQIEQAILSIASDETGDKDAEEAIREGAHMLATRDLTALTDAMKQGEQVMKDAMKGVDPTSLKALEDFVVRAPR